MTYVLHDWFPAPQAMIPFSNGLSNSMMPNGWQSRIQCRYNTPERKVYGANMGPTLDQQEPGGPHVGPMNLAIWDSSLYCTILHTALEWLMQSINQGLNSQKTLHSSPVRVSYGPGLWGVYCENFKENLLFCNSITLYCVNQWWDSSLKHLCISGLRRKNSVHSWHFCPRQNDKNFADNIWIFLE